MFCTIICFGVYATKFKCMQIDISTLYSTMLLTLIMHLPLFPIMQMIYCALEYFFTIQVQQVNIAHDDAIIDNLLDKTTRWSNETKMISEFFDTSVPDTLRNKLLGDSCGTIETAFNQTLDVIAEKACRMEQAISKLPSLEVMDEFVMTLCGYYCHSSCSMGFPYEILSSWKECLDHSMANPVSLKAELTVQVTTCPFCTDLPDLCQKGSL